MATKTIQALKVRAALTLSDSAKTGISKAIFAKDFRALLSLTSGKLKINYAIAARFDDPAYMARASDRIAEIKAALSSLGTLDEFAITAGSVPLGTAEILADLPAPADTSGEELPPAGDRSSDATEE